MQVFFVVVFQVCILICFCLQSGDFLCISCEVLSREIALFSPFFWGGGERGGAIWYKKFRDGSHNSSGIRQAADAERMNQKLD